MSTTDKGYEKVRLMTKNKVISKNQEFRINFFKKLIIFITQLLKADLRLPIYSGFLAGKFIWMRPMFPNDRFIMEDCFTDPSNMKYFGAGKVWSKTQIETSFYKNAYNNLNEPDISAWSIISHQGLTGCFFITRKKCENSSEIKKKEETIEIGYCLRQSLSGKGYTTEAGQLITDSIAPDFNGLFFATVHPKNKGSQRVLEKIGLTPDIKRQNVWIEKYNAPRNFYQLLNKV